jgi:hypothetical protein
MPFFEIKYIPRDGSTGGKYRFYDIVYYDKQPKLDVVKKEFQELLRTQHVKVLKRSTS